MMGSWGRVEKRRCSMQTPNFGGALEKNIGVITPLREYRYRSPWLGIVSVYSVMTACIFRIRLSFYFYILIFINYC